MYRCEYRTVQKPTTAPESEPIIGVSLGSCAALLVVVTVLIVVPVLIGLFVKKRSNRLKHGKCVYTMFVDMNVVSIHLPCRVCFPQD